MILFKVSQLLVPFWFSQFTYMDYLGNMWKSPCNFCKFYQNHGVPLHNKKAKAGIHSFLDHYFWLAVHFYFSIKITFYWRFCTFFFIKIQTCEGSFKTRLPFSVACFCIPHIIKLFPWNAHFQFICPHSDSLSKPLNKALELAQKQTSVTYLSRARCSKTLSTIQVNRVELSTSRSYSNSFF